MVMSPEAIASDKQLNIPLINPKKIFIDHDFNSREAFTPTSCIELAADIANRGILCPITIRPLRAEDRNDLKNEQHLLKQGYTHITIAGHRRLTAYLINEAEGIPCIIKDAYISLFDQKDINAVENLQRLELNLKEECDAIRHYWMAGWNREETAKRIQKSQGWVQIRYMLLEMPEEIQILAGQGLIKGTDIRELNKYKGEELMRMAAQIRDKRRAGEKRGVTHSIKKKEKFDSKKIRTREEMFTFMEVIRNTLKKATPDLVVNVESIVTPQGNTFAVRCLSWAAGEITSGEVHVSFRDFCADLGIDYEMPDFGV